jgi:hypothetical protein
MSSRHSLSGDIHLDITAGHRPTNPETGLVFYSTREQIFDGVCGRESRDKILSLELLTASKWDRHQWTVAICRAARDPPGSIVGKR